MSTLADRQASIKDAILNAPEPDVHPSIAWGIEEVVRYGNLFEDTVNRTAVGWLATSHDHPNVASSHETPEGALRGLKRGVRAQRWARWLSDRITFENITASARRAGVTESVERVSENLFLIGPFSGGRSIVISVDQWDGRMTLAVKQGGLCTTYRNNSVPTARLEDALKSLVERNPTIVPNKVRRWADTRGQRYTLPTYSGPETDLWPCEIGLMGVEHTGSHLENVDFRGKAIQDVSFVNCNLRGARFDLCTLTNVRFINCDLSRASFVASALLGCDFVESRVVKADFKLASIYGNKDCSASGCDFSGSKFTQADIREFCFRRTTLRYSVFAEAEINDCHIEKCDFTFSDFSRSEIASTMTKNSVLDRAEFAGSTMWGSTMYEDCQIEGCSPLPDISKVL